jgi:hypothetical protein
MASNLIGLIALTFFLYLGSLLFFYFLGIFFCRIAKITTGNFNPYFLYCLTGLIAFSIGFSLFYSNGIGTLNFVLLVLFVFWLFVNNRKRKHIQEKPPIDWFEILLVFLISLFVFIINLYLRLSVSEWPFFKATKDEIFYSLVTKLMANKHIENSSIDWYYFKGAVNLRPYHYIEQWPNLFFSELFSLSSLTSLFLIVTPIFFFITTFGILSLINLFTSIRKPYNVILAFILCFIGFPAVSLSDLHSIWMASPIPGNLKYFPLLWIAFIATHLIKNKQWNWLFSLMAILPLFNYGLYPVTLVFFLVYIFLFSFLFKQKRKPFVFVSYVLCLVGIPLMAKLNFSPEFHGQYDQKLSEVFGFYFDDLLWQKTKLIFGMGWFFLKNILVNNILSLVLLAVLFSFAKRKSIFNSADLRPVVILIAIITISSLFISSLLNFLLDAYQIFYLTFQIVLSSLLLILIIICFNYVQGRFYKHALIILLVCMFVLNISVKSNSNNFEIFKRYDNQFRNEIKEEFVKRYKGGFWNGVRFMSKNYYKDIYQIQSTDQYEGFPFVYLTDQTHLFTLNTDVVEKKEQDFFGIYKFSYDKYSNIEYFKWWAKDKGLDISNSDELQKAQLKFITEFKVNFIVVQLGASLPEMFTGMVDKEIISRVNGERVYFLKQ